MSAFTEALERVNPEGGERRWVFVPYDQLTDRVGPLAELDPNQLGVVMVETTWKPDRRPYHRQKLALVLANMRHFAIEQARRGVRIEYLFSDEPYSVPLAEACKRLGPLLMMEAAERELRVELAELVAAGSIEVTEHGGWLTDRDDFTRSQPDGPPWRMDRFYRAVRRRTGLLMSDDGKPIGGKFSFDADNRKPWSGDPPAPNPPVFEPDAIKTEVVELVRERFADHPGSLSPGALCATAADVDRAWQWAKQECLPTFGPYEDAMSRRSVGLFHTRISPLLNISRLLPAEVIADAIELGIEHASLEGFVRQVLGWREFVRHVHRETDGFREPGTEPGYLAANRPLPPAFWGTPSGLACLDQVVGEVWEHGYSHHITRLMVASNIASLLDVDPRELSDWFWVAYVNAYDWVVEPNVIGMGTFGVGPLMTTKPYVSGANYINRMSDYCDACQFDPKRSCPLTRLYWAYLARHRDRFAELPRMRLPLASLDRRAPEDRASDAAVFEQVSSTLARASALAPEEIE